MKANLKSKLRSKILECGQNLQKLSLGFYQNDRRLIEEADLSLASIIIWAGLIGAGRHYLEVASDRVFFGSTSFASVTNTLTFTYLLVFLGLPLVILLGGKWSPEDLKNGLKGGLPLLGAVFLTAALGDIIFNYTLINLPIITSLPLVPVPLFVAVGSWAGFLVILYKGSKLFSGLWDESFSFSLARILPVLFILYGYTYILGIGLTWPSPWQFYQSPVSSGFIIDACHLQFNSLVNTIPLLCFLPFLYRELTLTEFKKDEIAFLAFYFILALLTALFIINSYQLM